LDIPTRNIESNQGYDRENDKCMYKKVQLGNTKLGGWICSKGKVQILAIYRYS